MATTVVALRLVAAQQRSRRPVAVEEELVHPPQAWGPLLPDGPVSRNFDRTDLQGLTHAHSSYSTWLVSQPCLSLSPQHTCAAS